MSERHYCRRHLNPLTQVLIDEKMVEDRSVTNADAEIGIALELFHEFWEHLKLQKQLNEGSVVDVYEPDRHIQKSGKFWDYTKKSLQQRDWFGGNGIVVLGDVCLIFVLTFVSSKMVQSSMQLVCIVCLLHILRPFKRAIDPQFPFIDDYAKPQFIVVIKDLLQREKFQRKDRVAKRVYGI
ncbi:hypothetical protein TNCV_1430541 [Trichonephila clavipes]|nr:hypothetical protein TNCV_1430541 [Trichonephila clavipes]